jgi:hypothetical protein
MNPPDNADLFRLVYRSRSTLAGSAEEVRQAVDALLATARRRNAAAGVTGAVIVAPRHFVQALEGPAAAVEAIFDRICCDLRHAVIEVVECGPVLEPAFGGGAMSHLIPDAEAGALLDQVGDETELAEAAAAAMRLMLALLRPSDRGDEPSCRPERAGNPR